jgi:hypothetical protein
MFSPVTVEEVRTVERFRVVTSLRADEKRRRIAALAGAMAAVAVLPPHKAAGMLAGIWRARTALDWGCRPVVGR